MRCDEAQRNLDVFIRHGLTPMLRERIESHLSSCGNCREELARLRRLEGLLTTASAPPVPAGFAQRVVAKARCRAAASSATVSTRHRIRKRVGRRVPTAVGAAAALASGLLLGGFLGGQTLELTLPSAVEQADPLADAGLGQLVDPGGESLSQSFLAMTTGGESEGT